VTTIAEFVHNPTTASYPEGGEIFREHDDSDGRMYVLLEGEVWIERQGRMLERITECGGVFGEIGLIDQLPRSATATAARPTRVAVINDEDFRSLILRNPSFALEIMRLLTRRARANLPL
jgi:CRP-like cAMP-binding protein